MIENAVHIVGSVCLLAGALFVFIGGVGLIRLPDFYTRLHGGGVTDTLGAALVLLGLSLMFNEGLTLSTVKLVIILVFLLVTSPTSCHALAQAARAQGLEPQQVKKGPDCGEMLP